MKKWVGLCLLLAVNAGAAVPQQITYQGTLKQGGAVANGTYTMTFRLTDSGGLTQYWNSGPMQIAVTQGLFSQALSPAGVDWANVTPFIVVNVNGQDLGPPEPVTSSAYALECGSMVGMIAMFAKACPVGWTRFTAMDDKFPMGGTSYGATGGSASVSTQEGVVFGEAQGSGSFATDWRRAVEGASPWPGGPPSSVSNLPPYLTVVFCQKQ